MSSQALQLDRPAFYVIQDLIGKTLSLEKSLSEFIHNPIDAIASEIFIGITSNTLYIYDNGHGCGGEPGGCNTTRCLIPSDLHNTRGNDSRIGKYHRGYLAGVLSLRSLLQIWSTTKTGEVNYGYFEAGKFIERYEEWDKEEESSLSVGDKGKVLDGLIALAIPKDQKEYKSKNFHKPGYAPIPLTGIDEIDTRVSKMTNGKLAPFTLIRVHFLDNSFLPNNKEDLEKLISPLKFRFPFPEPKIMAIHKQEDGEIKKVLISNKCHPCGNGSLGTDYALYWHYEIFELNPGVSIDLPKEILKLTHMGNMNCGVPPTSHLFKAKNNRDVWRFDPRSWADGDDGGLNEEDLNNNYTRKKFIIFMINRLGHENHIKQLKCRGLTYEFGHLPCYNIMNHAIAGGGENITLNLGTGKMRTYITNIHQGQKNGSAQRYMINIDSKKDYTAWGIGGDKTQVTIQKDMMTGDPGTVFDIIMRFNQRICNIFPTKPEKSAGAEWSKMQETIKLKGSNSETFKIINNSDWTWHHLRKEKRTPLNFIYEQEQEALAAKYAFNSPWDVVNNCLIEEDSSANEEEMEDEEEGDVESPEEEEEEEVADAIQQSIVVNNDEFKFDQQEEEVEDDQQDELQLVITESDEGSSESNEDTDLPISDNTTIPSHNRLCSKTAANARDALPLAWPKMSRNKRMKNFKEYWLQQLTCDEIYAIEEGIIAKQCNIDENAKLCGAATLVKIATSEETSSNSSGDSD